MLMRLLMKNQILETGRWWEDTWWEGEQYWHNHPVEDVRAAAQTLRDFFPEKWVLEKLAADPHHPIIGKLCFERGVNAEHFIISTAEFFTLLSSAKGFGQKFADFTGKKYRSTQLEFQTAAVLVDAGLAVEFPPEASNKTADILARDGDTVIAIECKRLEQERWEAWASDLMNQVIFTLPHTSEGRDIVVQIGLDERLSEILMGPDFDDFNRAIVEEICSRVQRAILGALGSRHLPINLEIPGIGKAAILPKDQGAWGSVSGMPISRVAKLRRILQNGLFRAVEQLQGEAPGIAVVYSDFSPDPGLARAAFDAITRARRASYRNLLAMIILPLTDKMLPDYRMVLENANSDFAEKRFRALDALRQGFGAKEV